jgi:hypothetical protein
MDVVAPYASDEGCKQVAHRFTSNQNEGLHSIAASMHGKHTFHGQGASYACCIMAATMQHSQGKGWVERLFRDGGHGQLSEAATARVERDDAIRGYERNRKAKPEVKKNRAKAKMIRKGLQWYEERKEAELGVAHYESGSGIPRAPDTNLGDWDGVELLDMSSGDEN